MEKKYIIYCDMDGVLVDFCKGYYDLTGIKLGTELHTSTDFWDPINKAGYEFWVNLDWTSDGKVLWDYIEKYNTKLLSAPSRQDDSRVGKYDWVDREIPGAQLLLRTAKYKKEFAQPNSILIDDREENIQDWINSNGIGILHKNSEDTIEQLKKLSL